MLELFIGAYSITLGLFVFFFPVPYETSSSYKYLSTIGTGRVFGIILILISVVQFIGVIMCLVKHPKRYLLRSTGTFVGVGMWIMITVASYLSGHNLTSTSLLLLIAVAYIYSSIKIAAEGGNNGFSLW